MHLRFWVYRRNLSNNPASPFRSNAYIMQRAGCCISGFLGLLFLGLALMCLFSPISDNEGNLFLLFMGLFSVFEVVAFIYCCIPYFEKYCICSNDEEEHERSFLSSEESSYEENSGYQRFSSYQACASYSDVPIYEANLNNPEVPTYQAGPSYQGVSNYQPAPYGAEGGFIPGLACLRPLVNYEGVLVYQQIPVYHQDLVEPQLPPYSSGYIQCNTSPRKDILVY